MSMKKVFLIKEEIGKVAYWKSYYLSPPRGDMLYMSRPGRRDGETVYKILALSDKETRDLPQFPSVELMEKWAQENGYTLQRE